MNLPNRITWVLIFSIAFAFVESAIVVYLRLLYYPDGFTFPLRIIPEFPLAVELARELATLVMLGGVGIAAGVNRWSRFAYFALAFGVWDIFYYVWLKVLLGWPTSLLEWDVLFLIPVPWIGPVVAPVLVSVLLITAGLLILRREQQGRPFKPGKAAWILSLMGSALILFSFMYDLDATLHGQMPQPYRYELLVVGLLLYGMAMTSSFRHPD